MVTKAVFAALVAFAVAAALTPARGALRAAASARSTSSRSIGLARKKRRRCSAAWRSSAARSSPGLLFLPDNQRTEGILAAAALITIVGALDDIYDLHPRDQARRARSRRRSCSSPAASLVDAFTFPFLHRVELGELRRAR